MTTKIEISSSMNQVDVCIVNKEVTLIGPRANSSIDTAFAIVLSSRSGSLTLIPLESRVLTYKSRTLKPHEPVQIKTNGNERFTFSVGDGIQCRILRAPRQSAPPTTLPMTEIADGDDEEEEAEEKSETPEGKSPAGAKSGNNVTLALPSPPSHTLPLPETSTTPENNGGGGTTVTVPMPEESSTSNLPTATVPMAGGDTDEEEEEDIVTDDNEGDDATRESAAPPAATVPVETQLVTQAGPSDLVTQGSVNELEPLVTQLDDDLPPGEIMTTQSENEKPSPQKEDSDKEEEEVDDANSVNSEDMLLQKPAPLTPHTTQRTTQAPGNGAYSTPSRRLASSAAEAFRSPSTAIFDHMTDDEIRTELASHRLDTSGSRTVLAKRLAAHRAMSDNDLEEDLPRSATPRGSPGASSLAPTTVGSALSKNTRRIVDEDDRNNALTLKIEDDDGTSPTLKIPVDEDNKVSSNGKDEMVIKSQSLREALKAERSPLQIDLTSSRDATTGSHFSGSTTGEALMALTKSNAESDVVVIGDNTDKAKKANDVLLIKEDGEGGKSKEEEEAEKTSEVVAKKTRSKPADQKDSVTTTTNVKSTTRSTRGANKESIEAEEEEGRPIVRVGTVEAAHALGAMRSSVSPTTSSASARKQSPPNAKKDEEEVGSAKRRERKRVAVKEESAEDELEEKSEESPATTTSRSKRGAAAKKETEEKKKVEGKRSSRRGVEEDEEEPSHIAAAAPVDVPIENEEEAKAAPKTRRGQTKTSIDEKVVGNEAKKAKVVEEEETLNDESNQPRKSGRRSSSSSKKQAEEDASSKVDVESTTAGSATKAKRTRGGKASSSSKEDDEAEQKKPSKSEEEAPVPVKDAKRGRAAKAEPDLKTPEKEEEEEESAAKPSSAASKSKRVNKSAKKDEEEAKEEETKSTTTAGGDGPSSSGSKRARMEKKSVVVGSASKKQPQKESPPRIVFTNVEVTDVYRKYVSKIGGKILNGDDEDFDKNLVTHVVCLKGSLKRTQKLLRAMAMAGPNAPKIVHNDWLKESAEQGKVLDEKLYFPFEGEENMEEALMLRHQDESEGLLSGMTILVAKSLENEKNLPNYHSLLPIVTSAGGQIAIATKEELNKCSPKTTIVLGPNQAFTKPFKDVIEKRKLTWCAPTWLAQSIASYSLKTDSEASDIIFNRGGFFI